MPEQYNLRALDSFQFAAALVLRRRRPKGKLLICRHMVLAEATVKAGFEVSPWSAHNLRSAIIAPHTIAMTFVTSSL
jgi:hypothetical protein